MKSTPSTPSTPALIPGAAPPARRKHAISWTSAEKDFAIWLLKTWNETVGPVAGRCYHTRRNNFNAIQLYRRLNGCVSGFQPENQPIFSNDAIRKALAAYADQARSIEPQFWLTFQGWCKNAEDHISRQLTRLGIPADHDAARKAAALALTEHLGLGGVARHAASTSENLEGHLRWALARLKTCQPTRSVIAQQTFYQRLWDLLARFGALDADQRRLYHKRAANAFRAAHGRDPQKSHDDSNLTHALALAIFDLDSTPSKEKEA